MAKFFVFVRGFVIIKRHDQTKIGRVRENGALHQTASFRFEQVISYVQRLCSPEQGKRDQSAHFHNSSSDIFNR
jgi:hypothetical protein